MTRKELISASNPVKNGRGTRRIVRAVCLRVLSLCCVNATPPARSGYAVFLQYELVDGIPSKADVARQRKVG
jgi:hypothetical protein